VAETLRIIALGGLGEVGKNMTVFEVGDERIVLDAGLAFAYATSASTSCCRTSPTSSGGPCARSS
jgi:mRNA degradation ribonuclease J1/J2